MAATTVTASAIIFSINSAIKLSSRFRKAYSQSLKSKRIILPLPKIRENINQERIERFFREEGKQFLGRLQHLDDLHQKSRVTAFDEDGEDYKQYSDYFDVFWGILHDKDDQIDMEEALGLCKIRQWEHGQVPRNSVLQLVAGTVVEVGIDYFNQVPGALNIHSSKGKAIKHFLQAFDEIDFAETDNLKRSISFQLVPRLFASAAESIATLSEELVADVKLQNLIKATTKGIADDIYHRINNFTPLEDQEDAIQWGQLIVKSTIENAGKYAFSNTSNLFGTNEATSQLIESTGKAFLGSILESGTRDGLNLKQVFTVNTLNSVMKSAFSAMADHPQWISRHEGIRGIISGVCQSLSQSGIQRPGLAPELMRLAFEHTAKNMELFWGDNLNFREGVLMTTIQEVLSALASPAQTGVWKPQLSNTQILELVHNLTEKATNNQAWAMKAIDDQTILGKVLKTSFSSLKHVPPQDRFSVETLNGLIHANLRAVAQSPRILNKIDWGTNEEEVVILEKALDLIYSFTFKDSNVHGLGRVELLTDLVEFSFDMVLRQNPNKKGLILLDVLFFRDTGIDFSGGFNKNFGHQLINATLTVLDEYTDLVSSDHLLKSIISDTAHALRTTLVDRQELLPEFVRMIMENTAGNLDLLLVNQNNRHIHLLVTSLKAFLGAVSQKPAAGRWRPRLSNEQVFELYDVVAHSVVANPDWARNEMKIFELVNAAFRAIETVPEQRKLPFAVVSAIVQKSFESASAQKQLMLPVETTSGGTKKIALEYSWERLFITIYDEQDQSEHTWNLSNTDILLSIMEYFMAAVASSPASKNDIDEVVNRFNSAFINYKNQTITTVDELLMALDRP